MLQIKSGRLHKKIKNLRYTIRDSLQHEKLTQIENEEMEKGMQIEMMRKWKDFGMPLRFPTGMTSLENEVITDRVGV